MSLPVHSSSFCRCSTPFWPRNASAPSTASDDVGVGVVVVVAVVVDSGGGLPLSLERLEVNAVISSAFPPPVGVGDTQQRAQVYTHAYTHMYTDTGAGCTECLFLG